MGVAPTNTHFVFFGTYYETFHAAFYDERIDAFMAKFWIGLGDH